MVWRLTLRETLELERLDLLRLPLHSEAAEGANRREVADQRVRRCGEDDLPRLPACLETCGKVHGVPVSDVVAEFLAAHVPDERRSRRDADAEARQRWIFAHDVIDRALHRERRTRRGESVSRLLERRV